MPQLWTPFFAILEELRHKMNAQFRGRPDADRLSVEMYFAVKDAARQMAVEEEKLRSFLAFCSPEAKLPGLEPADEPIFLEKK